MNSHILRPVYTGVAVADIEYGSNILHVKPLEPNPSAVGEVSLAIDLVKIEIETRKGLKEYKAIFSDYLMCSWLNRNSNRITAPDVKLGERIQIWQNADTEDFYWEPLGIDQNLRTLEHVIFAFSNTNNEDRSNKKLDFTNCYIMEFDTINKKIRIKTNKNDEEPFEYEILLNTKEGFFKVNDDVGNQFLLDSTNTVIEMLNKDKSQYRLDKKDIIEKCDGNRTVTIGGNDTLEVGGNVTLDVGGNVGVKATDFAVDSATSSFTGVLTVVEMTGEKAAFSVECTAPNI